MGSVPDFVYISYIAAVPEKLWQALTNPTFISQYFAPVECDWKPGSNLYFVGSNGKKLVGGKVLRCEPPRLLSYTFEGEAHAHPELPDHVSVATFEIQAHGEGSRLILTHSRIQDNDLDVRRDTFHGLNNGWPAIISKLKTLLETGRPLVLESADGHGEYLKQK